ncbi:MAG: DMT family transporter [Treponema sp.]|nr:DMT family transporter [Treponema sp.]
MNKRALRADLLLLLTATIWGFGFTAQRAGMEYVGPFAYNGIRFLLGGLFLVPFALWSVRRKRRIEAGRGNTGESASETRGGVKRYISAAFLAGSCIFVGVAFQQLGVMFTTAGNAGFITGLYVIFTPIFGIFLNRKTGAATWVGALLTFTGLFFLSFSAALTDGGLKRVNPGDILVVISAVFWAFHVLLIDRLVKKTDPVALSLGQFVFAGIYGFIAAFLFESPLSRWLQTLAPSLFFSPLHSWVNFPDLLSGLVSGNIPLAFVSSAMIPILYGGLMSAGVGYTLQVVAQRDAPPAHATIILCLEGCFAVIGGVLFLNEQIGAGMLLGFALILSGMLASQWEVIARRKR